MAVVVCKKSLIAAAFLILIVLVACTSSQVKDKEEDEYAQDDNRVGQQLPNKAKRAEIVDRSGTILVMSKDCLSAYVPAVPGSWVPEVCSILGIKEQVLMDRISSQSGMVCLSSGLTQSMAQKLKSLGIKGLRIYRGYKRQYPYGSLASPVLGLVDSQGMGVKGVESSYNRYLSRACLEEDETLNECSKLRLCLEKGLQFKSEKELVRQMRRLRASSGCLVIMDVVDGQILSLASRPAWNPRRYWEYDLSHLKNQALAADWDPILILPLVNQLMAEKERLQQEAMALKQGPEGAQEQKPETKTQKAPVVWHWTEVKQGLNIWSPWPDEFFDQTRIRPGLLARLYELGFGRPTGIDLPDEELGALPTGLAQDWTQISGLRATPLQILKAFSCLVTGGDMPVPHVVMPPVWKRAEGNGRKGAVSWLDKDLSQNLSNIISHRKRPYLISVATTTDDEESYQVVLLGFWPVKEPRVCFILALDGVNRQPQKVRGTFLGILDLAKQGERLIFDSSRHIAWIGRDRATRHKEWASSGRMPDLRGKPLRQAYRLLKQLGLEVKIQGTGRVKDQFPRPGARLTGIKSCRILCDNN